MQGSLEDIAHTLGAIVSPGVGSAELIVAAVVAFGFLGSAIYSIFARGNPDLEWWER
jgi:hypothetical protein